MENEQEINSETCAINYTNEKTCCLIQGKESIRINSHINQFLNYNCNYFGSSLEGRLTGSKQLLGMKYKLPIIIEESQEIILFPTKSYRNHSSWISLTKIQKYEKSGKQTLVTFTTGKIEKYDISYESFENQVLRATKLLLILKNHKSKIDKKILKARNTL
ncbi:MAG: competence protein ComK [Bacilli bacterium]|nr:competence protein ComK [Bacilli bacterium]